MCIGGSSSVSYSASNASNDPINSAYPLPPELTPKETPKPKNKSKSLVNFGADDRASAGSGVTFSGPQPLGQPLGSSSGYGFRDASGGFRT